MNKRMIAWMLVMAFLRVPSVWADPRGEVQGPVESAVVSPNDAGRASDADKVVANLTIAMAMEGAQAAPPPAAVPAPPPPPPAAKGPPKSPGGVVEDLDKAITDAGGQILIIMVGATWCHPCHQTVPVFNDLAKKYPNLTVIVVDVDGVEKQKAVHAIAKQYPYIKFVLGTDASLKRFLPVKITSFPTILTPNPREKDHYMILSEGKPSTEQLKAWEVTIQKHPPNRRRDLAED